MDIKKSKKKIVRHSPGEMFNPFSVSVPFTCNENKFNGFYMKGTLAGNELTLRCKLSRVTYDGAFWENT